ncbi:MAG: hypothetical protein AAF587_38565 [Bacteroidota bacterium]
MKLIYVRNLSIFLLAFLGKSHCLLLSQVVYDPMVIESDFSIERFAAVSHPLSLAISEEGEFGRFLYVGSADLSIPLGTGPVDSIFRIRLDTPIVQLFCTLPAESDPVWLEFGPGAPFSSNLYICSNNRDGGQGGDRGGSVIYLDHASCVEQFLTAMPSSSTGLSELPEPYSIAFGPGISQDFPNQLFVTNTSDPDYEIILVDSSGATGGFATLNSREFSSITFGPGGSFGTDLYVSTLSTGTIYTVDSSASFTPFLQMPGFSPNNDDWLGPMVFAPKGPFGGDLYVMGRISDSINIYRISPNKDITLFATGFLGAKATGASSLSFPTPDALAFNSDGSSLFVADNGSDTVFRIYYNPVGSFEELQEPLSGMISVELFSLDGQLLRSYDTFLFTSYEELFQQLTLDGLEPSVYVLKIIPDKKPIQFHKIALSP